MPHAANVWLIEMATVGTRKRMEMRRRVRIARMALPAASSSAFSACAAAGEAVCAVCAADEPLTLAP